MTPLPFVKVLISELYVWEALIASKMSTHFSSFNNSPVTQGSSYILKSQKKYKDFKFYILVMPGLPPYFRPKGLPPCRIGKRGTPPCYEVLRTQKVILGKLSPFSLVTTTTKPNPTKPGVHSRYRVKREYP